MADRSVSVGLSADISKWVTGLERAAVAADRLAESTTKAGKAADGLGRVGASSRKVSDELGKSEKKVSAFGSALTKIDQHSADIDKVSNALLGVGGAAVAGVGLAVKTAADFDQSMSNVAATGQDARDNINQLRDAAIDMGASTSFSAGEAAAGIENLLKAGVSATDVMGGGLKGALDLAAAGQLDVGDAAEIAATAMTQFNLEGSEVPHIADLLAAGAGKAQGEVSDMGQALGQSGLVASQFGLSIEDTTGTLAAFASAGLIGSDAGTSFKTMLTSLANPSKESATLMRELGITAYDLEGNFVGVENLAGQLQDKLGGLDQATRDQALAQIFGNDAVRAANVLYKQGSDGISEWIANVDDQGYAAETAATKLDNLKGDLEELSGAFETALIGAGEGAQGPLREMVQGLTDLINKWNDLDDATKSNVVKVVATIGGILVSVGILGKLVTAGSEVVGAFRNIAAALPKAKRGLEDIDGAAGKSERSVGKFSRTAGLAGGALAALTIASVVGHAIAQDFTPSVEDATRSLSDLAEANDGKSLDEMFQFESGALIKDRVNGVAEAFSSVNNNAASDNVQSFFAQFFGGSSMIDDIRESFGALDTQLSQMPFDESAAAFQHLREVAEAQGVPLEKLINEYFPQYAQRLRDTAKESGVTFTSTEELARAMGGELPPAIQKTIDKQNSAKGSTEDLTGAMEDGTAASAEYKSADEQLKAAKQQLRTETDKLANSFTILKGGTVDVEEASNDYEQALDDLRDSTKEAKEAGDKHATSMDRESESGRNNRRVVLDAIKALDSKTTSVFKDDLATQGLDEATKNASKSLKQGKEDIRNAGRAAGLSEDEINEMIDEMVKTPKELKTEVEATDIKKVQQQVKDLEQKIKDLESKTVKITTDFSVKGTSVDFKTGKAVKIGNKVLTPYHSGGFTGHGGKFEPAGEVHRGEVVFEQEAVAAAGGPEKLDQFRVDLRAGRTGLPGYAGGGIVRKLNLAGRPVALSKRPFKLGGRPDELEELNIHGGLAGGRINPQPLIDGYVSQLGSLGTTMADDIAAAFKKNAEKAMADAAVGGNFGRIDVNNPRGLTTFRGHRFTNLAAATLRATEVAAGRQFSIFQGGWRPRTSYSGTSHQGDAIDARVDGALMRAGVKHGLKLWDRTGKGNWVSHMHGVFAPGAGYGQGSAVWQWQDYLRGGDGLAAGGPIIGPGGPTDDRILVKASNGEYMINAADYAKNKDLVHAINDGRIRSDRTYSRDTSPISYGQTSVGTREVPNVTIQQNGNYGWDPQRIAREEAKRLQDAMVMVGMTAAVVS